MLKIYQADLHIHSCLSPCGDLDMTPRQIVETAAEKELSLIAVTDHNATENIAATIKAASKKQVAILPGMEVTTNEEVHLLALFDSLEQAQPFQVVIYNNLLPLKIDQKMIEEQVVVNEIDEVEGFNEYPLLGACLLSIDEIINQIHLQNGLAIASHVDKENYSIINQLGFIPEFLALDGLEISPFSSIEEAKARFPDCANYPLVTFSDAHFTKDIGSRRTKFLLEKPSLAEIKLALLNQQGRKIIR